MTGCRILAAAALTVVAVSAVQGQQVIAPGELAIKYTRDSEEYATIARQTYRLAAAALAQNIPSAAGRAWAVVLDVDETALDNSVYQLERAAYRLPFDSASWSAWVRRRQAPPVPGVIDYIGLVRRVGGHVAWITNRTVAEAEDTKENLRSVQLWGEDDRLCAQNDSQHTKRARRAEVVSGSGHCAWSGQPMRVLSFVGDQMSDFPAVEEAIGDAGADSGFGSVCFLLPNPMYGAWTSRVTRSEP